MRKIFDITKTSPSPQAQVSGVPRRDAATVRPQGPQTFFVGVVVYGGHKKTSGDDLLSHHKAVPSALKGLTSVFGMGTGGTPSL